MGKYSGTDGLRGEANTDLIVEHTYRAGCFLGWCYGQKMPDERCRVAIGEDIRRSSYMFEYSLVARLTAPGADVYLSHVIITPSVSYVVRTEGFNCGITIFASYNPSYDNGIKVTNKRDEKLEKSVILEVEEYLDGEAAEILLVKRKHIGRTVNPVAGWNHYIGYPISIATRSFKNMKVALDCSNGSAFVIAKNVFDILRVETHVMNNEPNGLNINTNCGSTHIRHLQKFVVDEKCDIGFVYDGGVGRRIAVDKNGCVADGDSIMYICGKYMKGQGSLSSNTVITTTMLNFGLYKAFDREGIAYMKIVVGDKYVYENTTAASHCLGEEQSGHIILSKHAIAGDGILTSLKVMEVVLEKKQPPDKLTSEVEIHSQALKNVRVKDKKTTQDGEIVQAEVVRVTRSLGSDGRILLWQPETESVVHVMVGAPDIQACEAYVDQVVQAMKDRGHCI